MEVLMDKNIKALFLSIFLFTGQVSVCTNPGQTQVDSGQQKRVEADQSKLVDLKVQQKQEQEKKAPSAEELKEQQKQGLFSLLAQVKKAEKDKKEQEKEKEKLYQLICEMKNDSELKMSDKDFDFLANFLKIGFPYYKDVIKRKMEKSRREAMSMLILLSKQGMITDEQLQQIVENLVEIETKKSKKDGLSLVQEFFRLKMIKKDLYNQMIEKFDLSTKWIRFKKKAKAFLAKKVDLKKASGFMEKDFPKYLDYAKATIATCSFYLLIDYLFDQTPIVKQALWNGTETRELNVMTEGRLIVPYPYESPLSSRKKLKIVVGFVQGVLTRTLGIVGSGLALWATSDKNSLTV